MAYFSRVLLLLWMICAAIEQAAGSSCDDVSGTCQDHSTYCSGNYQSGLCPGAANIRCCMSYSMCSLVSGTCQYDSMQCSGGYESGLCPGSANVRCCMPALPEASACDDVSGTCQADSTSCSGNYQSGLCPGAANIRCCVPTASACDAVSGTCQADSTSCSGNYQSGLCPGAANIRCCVPTGACNVVSRNDWQARAPTSTASLSNPPVDIVFIHHTAGFSCTSLSTCSSIVRGTQNYHMDTRGYSDIAYSFLIGEDGRVYEGRGWTRQGAHTKNYNSISIAISFIGDFTSRLPNTAALNAAELLLSCGVSGGGLAANYRLYGHRDVGTTACPGNQLYMHIRGWSHYSSVSP